MGVLKVGLFLLVTLLAMRHAKADQALDAAIWKASQRYDVSPEVLRAIAHIESSGGKFRALRRNLNGTYDIGTFQINSVHWNATCKDYDISSVQGNALCAAKLLAGHKRHASTDVAWRGRYHSKTPSLKHQYDTKIRKYVQKYKSQYKLYVQTEESLR